MSPNAEAYSAVALELSPHAVANTRCFLDIPYGADGAHRLDVFVPSDVREQVPVFINIHGGNWSHGYKEWFGFGARPIVDSGAIYVSVEYRLSGAARWPAQIEDCLAALAWVHSRIHEHGGDPGRLFVGGHSAGAHLAAMVALRKDLYAPHKLPQDVVKGCFACSGIFDLRDPRVFGVQSGYPPAERLLASSSQAEDASPICWVRGNEVPFFISWGEKDHTVMVLQGAPFALALAKSPGRVETAVFAGFDHLYLHLDQARPSNYQNKVLRSWMNGSPQSDPMPLNFE